ncbi:MAG: AAA family ATPase, partial [Clostridia bacterium]|nr:AAA family ATPase [Clostridia bacterium]
MAVKNKTVYVCTECGAESPKWSGKCPACGQWDTMTEFKIQTSEKTSKQTSTARISSTAIKLSEIDESDEIRTPTNIEELDRVLGGGIVQGSLILVTGEPGIGKSTILLQICLQLGMTNKILYVSGEESPRQIKLRAERLGLADGQVYLLAKTDIEEIVEYARMEKPDIL